MALEALKLFAAEREQGINEKIESLAKNDPAERPRTPYNRF